MNILKMKFKNRTYLKSKKLKKIKVPKGDVFKFMDKDSSYYSNFGEIYFSLYLFVFDESGTR